MESHLLQMRGLKQDRIDRQVIAKESHLLQMRGLKLIVYRRCFYLERSHLLQMRGLKLFGKNLLLRRMLSHLLQMRGLKLKPKQKVSLLLCVASFTDAWIETISVFCDEESIVSRIFYRCVD